VSIGTYHSYQLGLIADAEDEAIPTEREWGKLVALKYFAM